MTGGRGTLRWLSRVTPWGAAAACFFYVPNTVWEGVTGPLITALSLLTAAILVRIMRAFPITDPDGFRDKEDIDSLEYAVRRIMASLSVAAGIAVATILLLLFRPVLLDLTISVPAADAYRGEAYSAAIGWMVTFVTVRITYVIRADFSIVSRQARAVRLSFERRRTKEAIEARRKEDDLEFTFQDEAPYPGRDQSKH